MLWGSDILRTDIHFALDCVYLAETVQDDCLYEKGDKNMTIEKIPALTAIADTSPLKPGETRAQVVYVQSRWRSKVLWVTLCAQVLSILQLTGIIAKLGWDIGVVGNVIAVILGAFATLGILNSPTDAKNF